jgi:hypothetical protein
VLCSHKAVCVTDRGPLVRPCLPSSAQHSKYPAPEGQVNIFFSPTSLGVVKLSLAFQCNVSSRLKAGRVDLRKAIARQRLSKHFLQQRIHTIQKLLCFMSSYGPCRVEYSIQRKENSPGVHQLLCYVMLCHVTSVDSCQWERRHGHQSDPFSSRRSGRN